MQDVKCRTREVYERHASTWDAERGRDLFEKVWLDRLLSVTRPGDTILDVGCGSGEPIARYLIERGRNVCGIDFAAPMLAIAQRRFPDARWIEADMRHLDLGQAFSAVIAWDSFFHLDADEQRLVIPRLCRHVAPGGALLVTVGPSEGEVLGTVEGEAVYHASLSIDEYERRFSDAGLTIADFVANDPRCGDHSVLLAVADLRDALRVIG